MDLVDSRGIEMVGQEVSRITDNKRNIGAIGTIVNGISHGIYDRLEVSFCG